jgi:hypothetical protein
MCASMIFFTIIFASSGGSFFGNKFFNDFENFYYIHQETGMYLGIMTMLTIGAAISGFYVAMSRHN